MRGPNRHQGEDRGQRLGAQRDLWPRSVRRCRGTWRTVEHGRHVLQQLEPSLEGAALDQVEPEVGISVIDPTRGSATRPKQLSGPVAVTECYVTSAESVDSLLCRVRRTSQPGSVAPL